MEPIHPSEARMKPNSCRPALAMARSKARAGSVAGAEGGVCKGAPLGSRKWRGLGEEVIARTPAPCPAEGEAPGFWSGSVAESGREKWQSSLRCLTARRCNLKQLRPSRHAAPPGGFMAESPRGALGPPRPALRWWGMSRGRPEDDVKIIRHP